MGQLDVVSIYIHCISLIIIIIFSLSFNFNGYMVCPWMNSSKVKIHVSATNFQSVQKTVQVWFHGHAFKVVLLLQRAMRFKYSDIGGMHFEITHSVSLANCYYVS